MTGIRTLPARPLFYLFYFLLANMAETIGMTGVRGAL